MVQNKEEYIHNSDIRWIENRKYIVQQQVQDGLLSWLTVRILGKQTHFSLRGRKDAALRDELVVFAKKERKRIIQDCIDRPWMYL